MAKRRVVLINEKPYVQPLKKDVTVQEGGVIYVMKDPKDEEHLVYKAHKMKDSKKFIWIGLWNSLCHSGDPADTLEELIKQAIDKGRIVNETTFTSSFSFNMGISEGGC